ncbi:MAG: LysR family transcriptional regulator, partial [Parvularculaceae bacterium]
MDRLQAIEIFIRVAELQSFAAAANDLNLSRTLVSDRVKGLEESLGVQLLRRTTSNVCLTES